MRWIWVVAVAFLAGCSEAPRPDGATPPVASGSTPAPTWSLGDFWSYQDSAGQVFTLVVAGEEGSHWRLLTDNQDVAYFDHLVDISYVGFVSKALLAGRQGLDEIRYFDFPLTDGKTWHTAWDGTHRAVEARQTGEGRFELTAYAGMETEGPVHVHYTYDSAKRFFQDMTFHNATTGEAGYTLTLTSHGSDYRGEVYVYDQVTELASASTSTGVVHASFDVPDKEGELAVQVEIDCAGATGSVLLAVDDPRADGSEDPVPPAPIVNEPAYGHTIDCPAGGYSGLDVLESTPGAWKLDMLVAAEGALASATVSHRAVTVIPVGPA